MNAWPAKATYSERAKSVWRPASAGSLTLLAMSAHASSITPRVAAPGLPLIRDVLCRIMSPWTLSRRFCPLVGRTGEGRRLILPEALIAVHVGCKMLIRADFIWGMVTGSIKLMCCYIGVELNTPTERGGGRPLCFLHVLCRVVVAAPVSS